MQQHGGFLQKGVSMTHPSGKKWLVKYGWCAHFQNSKGYFTTRWIAFTIDNELKVDNKFFIITSPSNIIVKVLRMAKVVLNVDDKVNKNDYNNDTKDKDIIDDEDYKEKDEDYENDHDHDHENVVGLSSNNEYDVLPSSLIDSNVNLRRKQQKSKELGHAF